VTDKKDESGGKWKSTDYDTGTSLKGMKRGGNRGREKEYEKKSNVGVKKNSNRTFVQYRIKIHNNIKYIREGEQGVTSQT